MRLATRALWCAVLAAAAAATLAASGTARTGDAVDRQSRRLTVGAGQTWSVTADVATVRVLGDPAARDVRIDITRHGAAPADLARLPIQFEDAASGPAVVLRQSDGALDPSLRAEVTITTPATGSRGSVSIVEGGLDVRGYHGRLDADVRRGPITAADVSGTLRLATTIGDVTVTGARVEPGGLLRLRAFNGDMRLGFAALPGDARVMALVLNGAIQSALPLTMKDGWGPRWGETTLGAGTNVVSLDVVTGSIRIDLPPGR